MLFQAMDAAASGLTAERLRLNIIADNLANVQTTQTAGGKPFRALMAEFQSVPLSAGGGVVVTGILQAGGTLPLSYAPGTPGANAQGFVSGSNVNPTSQMVDMVAANQAYNADAAMFSDAVKEGQAALNI